VFYRRGREFLLPQKEIAEITITIYLAFRTMNTTSRQDNLIASLRILNQIGASILAELTVEEIIEKVYHHVNQLMDAYSFGIGIYNSETSRFDYTGARENDKKIPSFSIEAHSPERFSGWVLANRSEILINDFDKEYHLYLPKMSTAMHGLEPASLMYVPIFINKEIVGILSVRTPVKNAYNLEKLEILKTLAVFISKALENSGNASAQRQPKNQLPKSYLLDPLSARELEVLNLLSKGVSNREIAAELFISASTVKTHTLNIYEKLEVANRTQAIVKAKEYRLIT
jgi:DNA-binding CsgD family transcriptional regulator